MRYFELNEDEILNDYIEFILENCQPYLKMNHSLTPMYRGLESNEEWIVKKIRTDRSPREVSYQNTMEVNRALNEIGAKAHRTNSIFCTGDLRQTEDYGETYVVLPIGNFNFTWSSYVKDLMDNIELDIKKGKLYDFVKENFRFDDDLNAAIASGCEILISGIGYVAVENSYYIDELHNQLIKASK